MDKTNLAISTYDKTAHRYAAVYFDDLSDTSYIDMFLTYIPSAGHVLDVSSQDVPLRAQVIKKFSKNEISCNLSGWVDFCDRIFLDLFLLSVTKLP